MNKTKSFMVEDVFKSIGYIHDAMQGTSYQKRREEERKNGGR